MKRATDTTIPREMLDNVVSVNAEQYQRTFKKDFQGDWEAVSIKYLGIMAIANTALKSIYNLQIELDFYLNQRIAFDENGNPREAVEMLGLMLDRGRDVTEKAHLKLKKFDDGEEQ